MNHLIRGLALATIGVATVLTVPLAFAQNWPDKPVKIVVPFPAGGMTDSLGRTIAQPLQAALGQPVIVENKPGANTMIAADYVAKAPADGYTVLMATASTLSINPLIYAKMTYDPVKDFTPVMSFANTVEAIIVNTSFPANDVAGLVKELKAHPGKYNYGSFGRGSNAQLEAEAFKEVTGTEMTHVPYKGVAEVMPALISNQINVVFTSQFSALPYIKSGKLKALAVLTDKRQPTLPDVQTILEAGYPSLQQKVWFGFVVRSGTPQNIVARLSKELTKIAESDDFQERAIKAQGLQSLITTPEQFAQILKDDREVYPKQVKAAKLVPE